MGHSKGSPERKVNNDTGLPKKDRNISNKQPKNTSMKTERGTGTTTKQCPEQVEGRKYPRSE